MKKISLIIMAIAALGLASCDETSKGLIQTNPQEPVMGADGFEVASSMPNTLNLIELNTANTPIQVGSVAKAENLPEAYNLYFIGEIGRDDQFARAAKFDLQYDPETKAITTTADDFEGAYIKAMGKSAKAKDIWFRVLAYAQNSENAAQYVRLGGENVYYCDGQINVTPFDLAIVIEDSYYVIGTACGWNMASAVKFDHSGKDPYDDPVFTKLFTISVDEANGGWWWKIVPGSTFANGDWIDADNAQFGPTENGDAALEGLLTPMKVDEEGNVLVEPGAGCLKTPGIFNFTIDMENQEYQFFNAQYVMYCMSAVSGNKLNKAPWILSPNADQYIGFLNLDGAYTFYTEASDNAPAYGKGAEEGTWALGGEPFTATAGFYVMQANVKDGKYKIEEVKTIGIVGGVNNWGNPTTEGDESTIIPDLELKNFSQTTGNGTWRGKVTLDGGPFKVRVNSDWSFNLGGTLDNLMYNGDNIEGIEAGTYNVTLHLDTYPYSMELVKK